jgi:hypothetical protein
METKVDFPMMFAFKLSILPPRFVAQEQAPAVAGVEAGAPAL